MDSIFALGVALIGAARKGNPAVDCRKARRLELVRMLLQYSLNFAEFSTNEIAGQTRLSLNWSSYGCGRSTCVGAPGATFPLYNTSQSPSGLRREGDL